MLSGTPVSTTGLTFHVVDDATANISYQYNTSGAPQGTTSLAAANAAPRGTTSSLVADKTWVIDANRNVYVYNTGGTLLGSWSAGSMANKATPEGIATDGNDIWIIDSKSDKVFRYAGAASRLSGSQNAASSFNLNSSNSNPKDIVTDGVALWTVDDGAKTDKVFKYSLAGSVMGSWTIDSANKAPTGITFDPANVADMWIVDSGTDRLYQYAGATSRSSGSQAASTSLALATADKNPQGIALVHGPSAEAPLQIDWVRQFGSAGDDFGRTPSTDSAGIVYMSGFTNGSLAMSNPTGETTPFLTQFDSAGNQSWLEQGAPNGENHDGVGVAADDLGNVFQVIGTGTTNASLDNYDATGALKWTTPLPAGEQVYSVRTDNSGYAYMESYANNFVYLRKFDAQTGGVVWQRTVDTGSTYENSSGLSLDGLGNVYLVGYTYGSLIGPNAGLADGFLAKYDTNGNLQWTRQFGTAGYDFAFEVAADSLGNVYTAGGVYANQDAWNSNNQDIFITKFDSAGNQQWTRQLATTANDQGPKLWTDNLGSVYFAGSSKGALAGPNQGGFDIVMGKYGAAGNLLWINQFGTPGDDIAGITSDGHGNFYSGGRTTGSWGAPNAGGADALLIKLSSPTHTAVAKSAALKVSTNSLTNTSAIGAASTSTASTTGKVNGINTVNNPMTSTATSQTSSLLLAAESGVRLLPKAADRALEDLADNGSANRDRSLDDELLLELVSGHSLSRAF